MTGDLIRAVFLVLAVLFVGLATALYTEGVIFG